MTTTPNKPCDCPTRFLCDDAECCMLDAYPNPAPSSTQDLIARLRASIAGKESYEEATVFVANISAAVEILEKSILATAEAK